MLLTQIIEISNYVFIAIFSIEMVFKLIGLGILGYANDPFNIFDGLIVCFSYIELLFNFESSGLFVLRTFRLLRFIKLFSKFPILRKQLFIITKCLVNVFNIFLLLSLQIFMFR